jgi:hypothetical protein
MCHSHVKQDFNEFILVLLRSISRLTDNENSCRNDKVNIEETFIKRPDRRQAY